MTRSLVVLLAFATLLLSGCEKDSDVVVPAPRELTAAAVDHFCGMNVAEHPGPKGQIILKSGGEPVWFSSSRDAIAFTRLPEEPKDIAAIYVSDMSHASNWEAPGAANWVEAKLAFYVVGSKIRGGMGAPETVPFSGRDDAEAFARKNGGRVSTFDEIQDRDVLGSDNVAGKEVGSDG